MSARVAAVFRFPLLNRDALTMLIRGADGDPSPLTRLTWVQPAGLAKGLRRYPASQADRLVAGLGLWPALLQVAIAFLWIGTGIVSLLNREEGLDLLARGGVTGVAGLFLLLAGAGWDIVLGVASFAKSRLNLVLVAQAVTMILYSLLATALVPSVWADPLGPLFRCWFALGWPAFAAVLVIFHLMIQKPALSSPVFL
jgi:hypothetical protein